MRDCSAISRSFVVSFFTQRHPQTKTNITERNDGLIDETKSRRRWDFGEFKDFIFAASQSFPFTALPSKTEAYGKAASKTWSFQIWPRKAGILLYISVHPSPPRGGELLPYKNGGDTLRRTPLKGTRIFFNGLVPNSIPPLRGTNSRTTNYIAGTSNFSKFRTFFLNDFWKYCHKSVSQ